jgi:hypothetical protein
MSAVAARPSQVVGTNATAGANRIATAFARARAEGRAALIPYVVAGYPDAETSLGIALAAADAGADLLEVGLPYSDPLADGATLQRASGVALRAGATLEGSLRLIERIGAARPDLPLVPMGYANQVIGGGDGEAVARRLGVPALGPEQVGLAEHGWTAETPLWFYILREADVLGDGDRLGPVGGRIVGEVIVGLIDRDPESFRSVDPDWTPTLPARAGTFGLADILVPVD